MRIMNINTVKRARATSRSGSGGRCALACRPNRFVASFILAAAVLCAGATGAFALKPPPGKGRVPEKPGEGKQLPKIGEDRTAKLPAKEVLLDPDAPRPIIKAEQDSHDFGTVWYGPILKHAFTVKNEGQTTLEITNVRPGCGCTIAGPYPKKIEPGESGEFPFSLQSTKLRGKFNKGITISSNDPVMPSLRLSLQGVVKRYVEVVPPSVYFGKLHGDELAERKVTLTNNTEHPLELKLKQPLKDNFEAKLVATTPGQTYDLFVTAKPPFKEGVFRQDVLLETNLEQQKEGKVDVRGTVPQRLSVTPGVLNINPRGQEPKKGEPFARTVRFTNYGRNPVKLIEATVDDPALSIEVKEQSEGKAYVVEVGFPADYELPDTGRTLILKTDDENRPVMAVPIKDYSKMTAADRSNRRPAEEMVGKYAPIFVSATTEGKSFRKTDLEGVVTVIDFFAPNCGFCKKQIPRLEKVRQGYDDKGVRFVAVSQTMRNKQYTKEQVIDMIKQLGFKGELAINHDNTIGRAFRAESYPTMVVIGKTGKIEAVNLGNRPDLEKRLTGQLDALIAGKPIPVFDTVATKLDRKDETKDPENAEPMTETAEEPESEKKPEVVQVAQRQQRPARARPDDLVGKTAPQFSFETLDGKKVSNATLAEHPAVVLNVVAPNCGFCKKQLPRMDKIRKQYAEKGVRFINVAQTMRKRFSQEETVDVMKQAGSRLELAYDPDNTVGPLFNATGFPTMIVLGKSGKVEAVNVGNLGDLETRVTGQLDALIAGKPVPQVAAAPPPQPPQRKTPDELVGKTAPEFSFETLDGKKVSNATLAEHPAVVLNVVAPNCGFCKKQMPRTEKIRQQYAEKGVRFINVAQTMRQRFSQEDVVKVFTEAGSKLEMAYDPDNKVGPLFNATGFPTMIVLGKSGKVEAVNRGNITDLETRLTGQLDALIAGKPVPQVAAAPPPQPPQRKRPDELVGNTAPSFSFETLDGKKVSNATLAEHPAVVLNVVAPNCGFCKKQVPRTEKIRQEYAEKGVRFINVAQTMRQRFSQEDVVKVFTEAGSNLEMAYDPDNKVGPLFNATGFPTMIVLGKSGKVEAVNVGNIGDLEKRLKGQLDALIAGKPVPKFADAQRPPRKRPDELVGKAAPSFSFETLDGKKVSNATLADHPAVVLNVVAPNCGFCKKQVPRTEKIRQEYAEKGVRFINVAQTMRKPFTQEEVVKVFNEEVGSKLELAYDPKNTVGPAFNATGFPTMIVLGKSGKVEAVNVGNIGDLETKLKGQLDALVAGVPIPKQFTTAAAPPRTRRRPAEDLVGKPAPAFSVETIEGKTLSNAGFKDHPATVLNFVAPNCGYCKRQLPNVEKVRAEYEAKGVRFVNVVQKMRKDFSKEEILDVMKGAGSQLEVSTSDFGDNKVGGEFKAVSFPTLFVVNRDGKIANVNVGAKQNLDALLKGQLDALLESK